MSEVTYYPLQHLHITAQDSADNTEKTFHFEVRDSEARAAAENCIHFDKSQTLTEEQKTIVKENIGVGSEAQVREGTITYLGELSNVNQLPSSAQTGDTYIVNGLEYTYTGDTWYCVGSADKLVDQIIYLSTETWDFYPLDNFMGVSSNATNSFFKRYDDWYFLSGGIANIRSGNTGSSAGQIILYDYNSYDCASSVYSADEDCVYSFDTNQKVLLKTDLSQSQPVCTTVLRLTSTGSICAGYVNLTDGYLYVFYSVFNQTDRKTYISRMETYRITDDPDNPVRVKSVDILDVSLLKCSAGAYSGSQQYQGLSLQPHPEGTLITDTYNKVAYLISYEGVVRRIYNLESDSQYPAEIMYYNQDADIYYFLDRLRGKIYYRSDQRKEVIQLKTQVAEILSNLKN